MKLDPHRTAIKSSICLVRRVQSPLLAGSKKSVCRLAIARAFLAYMSKVKWREEVRTDKPPQRIIRTVFLGTLAAVLTVIFHYGPGIHGMRQLAVSLAGFFFWWSLYANFKGRQGYSIVRVRSRTDRELA